MIYVLLIVGFILLIKGADYFVEGSASIAKIFKVPPVIIGLTIVAMGTSAPETAVSISAALKGANAISVSNIIGSNFFNLLVVVGVCAVLSRVVVTDDILKRDFPFSIAVTVLFCAMLFIEMFFISKNGNPGLNRIDGIILLLIFAYYLYVLISSALKARKNSSGEEVVHHHTIPVSILFILGGLAGVVLGGDMVVNNAKAIAKTFGMSDTLIGLTIVAVGTSLPELVTSFVAAKKGETEMALGNVVGSNVFNIMFVLGISTTLMPINLSDKLAALDAGILLLVNIIVLLMVVRDKTLSKANGALMILIYVAYTAFIIYRNYYPISVFM